MPQAQRVLQSPPGIETQNYTAKFSEKVAALADFRYDGRTGGVGWHRKMKDYLISKALEIKKNTSRGGNLGGYTCGH